MRTVTIRTLLVLVMLAPPVLVAVMVPQASACPFCDGGPSGVNEVRDGIFDQNFWPRVAATLAPFPILAGIVALIYFGPPGFLCSQAQEQDGTTSCSPQTEQLPRK